ncbi:TfoX/Sxy family protein [Bacteroidota bacterium]
MFGGMGFILNGNMCFGVHKNFLILRLGEETAEKALQKKQVRAFDITERPMKGWIMISIDNFKDDLDLKIWTERAISFVKTLPPK